MKFFSKYLNFVQFSNSKKNSFRGKYLRKFIHSYDSSDIITFSSGQDGIRFSLKFLLANFFFLYILPCYFSDTYIRILVSNFEKGDLWIWLQNSNIFRVIMVDFWQARPSQWGTPSPRSISQNLSWQPCRGESLYIA